MPYILPELRKKLDPEIDALLEALYRSVPIIVANNDVQAGHLNYCISKIIWSIFEADKNYSCANKLIGVLDAVKLEFYRRKVQDYENSKIVLHGDIICGKE